LGALLILPLAFAYAFAWLRRRTAPVKGLLALGLPIYAAGLAIVYAYNPFIGRFMLVPVGMAAALLAAVYRVRGVREGVAGLAVLSRPLAVAHNEQRRIGLSGSKPIWSMSRPDAEALAQPRMSTALEEIAAVVPANSEIGYVLGRDGWDYPLYGSTL